MRHRARGWMEDCVWAERDPEKGIGSHRPPHYWNTPLTHCQVLRIPHTHKHACTNTHTHKHMDAHTRLC